MSTILLGLFTRVCCCLRSSQSDTSVWTSWFSRTLLLLSGQVYLTVKCVLTSVTRGNTQTLTSGECTCKVFGKRIIESSQNNDIHHKGPLVLISFNQATKLVFGNLGKYYNDVGYGCVTNKDRSLSSLSFHGFNFFDLKCSSESMKIE